MIRAGSTTSSFAKRLAEHFNCSELKKDADKKSKLQYSSYPNEEASEKDKELADSIPIGRWDDIAVMQVLDGKKKIARNYKIQYLIEMLQL